MSTPASANYVLGHSVHEAERLMLQSRVLRPYTEKFFRAAGLAPGMRVLDLGSGMGDVSLLAADMVGPAGRVLGIDRNPEAVAAASPRRGLWLLLLGLFRNRRLGRVQDA
jgi:predicted RNA methylase